MIVSIVLGAWAGFASVISIVRPPSLFRASRGLAVRAFIYAALVCSGARLALAVVCSGLVCLILSMVAGFVAGSVVATFLILRPAPGPALPRLTRGRDIAGRHDAVVYFTHGEPERYDPEPWLHSFREFDESKTPFVPRLVRPLLLRAIRKHYGRLGTSGHRKGHERILAALQARFAARGDAATRFYLSFLDDHPHPDAVAIQAANEGASRIVMLKVFLTSSNHTAEGEAMVARLGLDQLGIPVLHTAPLWDSAHLVRMFVEKATSACPLIGERQATGILLVGHGQPLSWDAAFPTETGQEMAFRDKLRDAFVAAGFCAGNVRGAWMQFREPGVVAVTKAFGGAGIKRLLVFSAAISAESLHSQHDVPELVRRARIPSNIEIIHFGAWNDHPRLVEALEERVSTVLVGIPP